MEATELLNYGRRALGDACRAEGGDGAGVPSLAGVRLRPPERRGRDAVRVDGGGELVS